MQPGVLGAPCVALHFINHMSIAVSQMHMRVAVQADLGASPGPSCRSDALVAYPAVVVHCASCNSWLGLKPPLLYKRYCMWLYLFKTAKGKHGEICMAVAATAGVPF